MTISPKEASALLRALLHIALALPDGFKWPHELRRTYERAHRKLVRLGAEVPV